MPVIVKREPEFIPLYEPSPGTNLIVIIGGRGGKKTYEVSKFAAYSATKLKKRIVVVRDEKSIIKETILNEIWARYDTANADGILDQYFTKNETELKDRRTGKTLIYTKGFRGSSTSKKANLKGASDIDIAIIEEGEDINNPTEFNTFVDSLRKEGCLVIIMLNVPDIGHFLLKRYFTMSVAHDDAGKPLDGYFRIEPKEQPGFICIQTNYKDNPYLPAHIVYNYEAYGDPASPTYDAHYYWTQIRGYASTGRKGQILTKVKPLSLKDYLALPFKEYYGQDFGTARPAGMVGVKFDRNRCYARELNYLPMETLEIGRHYCRLKLNHTDEVIADCADDAAITLLESGFKELSHEEYLLYPSLAGGFFMTRCDKGPGSIVAGLSVMIGMELYAVEESLNLWDEVYKYCYGQDKFGNYTNEPIDQYNHLIDPLRYVIMKKRGVSEIFGL